VNGAADPHEQAILTLAFTGLRFGELARAQGSAL
jgi:hypothetical protein